MFTLNFKAQPQVKGDQFSQFTDSRQKKKEASNKKKVNGNLSVQSRSRTENTSPVNGLQDSHLFL